MMYSSFYWRANLMKVSPNPTYLASIEFVSCCFWKMSASSASSFMVSFAYGL
jgi:hypothetical protein